MSNNHTTDVPVETTSAGSHLKDSLKHTHPSFGMISVSRYSGSHGESLFGSEIESHNGIKLTIGTASVTQNLGRNWYHDESTLVEVNMTPVQYAEMITNPNTQGMPCTIRYTKEHGSIKYRPVDKQIEYVESKIETTIDKLKSDVSDFDTKISNILNKKGTLKRSDKDEIISLVRSVTQTIGSSLPYYEECITKTIDKQKSEARCEIDAHLAHVINKTGLEVLKNPKALSMLLESKTEDNDNG